MEINEVQHSQRRGIRSEEQQIERARDDYTPIPPSNQVGEASGERERDTPTDQDLSRTE